MIIGGWYAPCDDENWCEGMLGKNGGVITEWEDAMVLLRHVGWVERDVEEELKRMRNEQEDRMVWMHLQRLYADEVNSWMV